MYETLLNKYGVNQMGYYVKDAEEAAALHSRLFGSGPFVVCEVGVDKAFCRGKEVDLRLKVAFGQHAGLQVEIIQVLSADPNAYFEMGRYGFHHVSIWTDDIDRTIAEFEAEGFPVAMLMFSGPMKIAYFDCREALGYYVECHMPTPEVWAAHAAAARDWDGKDPVRVVG